MFEVCSEAAPECIPKDLQVEYVIEDYYEEEPQQEEFYEVLEYYEEEPQGVEVLQESPKEDLRKRKRKMSDRLDSKKQGDVKIDKQEEIKEKPV